MSGKNEIKFVPDRRIASHHNHHFHKIVKIQFIYLHFASMRKNGIEEDAELHGPVEHGAAETQKILHCSGIWWRGTCVCVCGFHVPLFS